MPSCSKLAYDNPGLVRNSNSEKEAMYERSRVTHQSIPAAPSAPPPRPRPARAIAGHLPPWILRCPGAGHLLACCRLSDSALPSFLPVYFRVCAFSIQRTRLSRSLEQARHFPNPSFRHARGFLLEYNYTEDFTGKQEDWLICQGREKNARISSLLIKPEVHNEIGSYRCESMFFWLLNQISVDIIWRTSFHI